MVPHILWVYPGCKMGKDEVPYRVENHKKAMGVKERNLTHLLHPQCKGLLHAEVLKRTIVFAKTQTQSLIFDEKTQKSTSKNGKSSNFSKNAFFAKTALFTQNPPCLHPKSG